MLDFHHILQMPDVFFEDEEVPAPPAHTLLYGMLPFGIGTPSCESLKSFVYRLAHEHRLSPTQLIADVVWPYLAPDLRAQRKTYGNNLCRLPYLDFAGKVTHGLAAALAELTGSENLQCCTLLPLSEVFNRASLARRTDRFCPLCLRDDNVAAKHVPLAWSVKEVEACPIHGVRLLERRCGAPTESHLHFMNRKFLPNVCDTCGSVGLQCITDQVQQATAIEIWDATQVAELIAAFPSAPIALTSAGLAAGLRQIIERVGKGQSAVAARALSCSKSQMHGWVHLQNRPSLGIMLHLCATAGVSLRSVVAGHADAIECPVPVPRQRRVPRKSPSSVERERHLRSMLLVQPPPSLLSVARQMQVDAKMLRDAFPELSATIVERASAYRRERVAMAQESCRTRASSLLEECERRNLTLTRRNLRLVSGDQLMPGSRLREVLQELIAERQAQTCLT